MLVTRLPLSVVVLLLMLHRILYYRVFFALCVAAMIMDLSVSRNWYTQN